MGKHTFKFLNFLTRARLVVPAACVSIALLCSHAQAQVSATPIDSEFVEEYREFDPTMAGARVKKIKSTGFFHSAMLLAEEPQPFDPGQFYFGAFNLLPDLNVSAHKVCTLLTSIDRRYTTNPEFGVIGANTGLSAVSYKSKHRDAVRSDFKDADLHARSYVGRSCSPSSSNYMLPLSTVTKPTKLHLVFAIRNAIVTPHLLDEATGNKVHSPFECVESNTVDGWECSLPLSAVEPGDYILSVQAIRQTGGSGTLSRRLAIPKYDD